MGNSLCTLQCTVLGLTHMYIHMTDHFQMINDLETRLLEELDLLLEC
jgi:hypothetical protein